MSQTPQAVIIGYGNLLRSDDGVGVLAVDQFMTDTSPTRKYHTLPQLDIFLTEELKDAKLVIFVDASREATDQQVYVRELTPYEGTLHAGHLSHISSPEVLLGITKSLYGIAPKAFLVAIKGHDFCIGDSLTEQCIQALPLAEQEIRKLLEQHGV